MSFRAAHCYFIFTCHSERSEGIPRKRTASARLPRQLRCLAMTGRVIRKHLTRCLAMTYKKLKQCFGAPWGTLLCVPLRRALPECPNGFARNLILYANKKDKENFVFFIWCTMRSSFLSFAKHGKNISRCFANVFGHRLKTCHRQFFRLRRRSNSNSSL